MSLGSPVPRWKPLQRARPPRRLRGWLAQRGSFTAALRRHCRGTVRAQVIRHRRTQPGPQERRLLGLRTGEGVLLRETLLRCGTQAPWVYAQTLIPLKHLHSGLRSLLRRGERPIGDLLFRPGHQLRRGVITVARLEHCILPHTTARPELWARRSVLRQNGHRLLITEVLLPDLPQPRQPAWKGR
ncbi:MAG: chorismate--pyruvate lyase family protein [Pseudomonadota bacterium]|uniref:chorismate--pyruvate lyase family protein n=1 Tax=Thermithiobacillus tepidarius TaxID=929 RepID=UPI00040CFA5B|nr:chorismate lyase [Thermithiobacillus tepidarius]